MAAPAVVSGIARRRAISLPEIIGREERRKARRVALRWAALAAVPLVAVGAWLVLRPRPLPLASRFRTGVATMGDVVREVHATGHVEARSNVTVGAEVSGRIASVDVDFNDTVQAGQILARFDRASLGAQLTQMRATLAGAQAALGQAQTDAERARRDLVRATRLQAAGIVTSADLDAATFAVAASADRVRAARAQVATQTAALSLARTNLSNALIRSPIDGVVITRNVDPGQTVASMLQSPVLFTIAADLRRMRVVAAVDEADIGQVAAGQHVAFSVNAYPDRVFHGVVVEVRNAPTVVQDVVTYGAVIDLDNADLALKPGMTASVRIGTGERRGVLRVPSGALHFTPPGRRAGGAPHVWTLRGDAITRVDVRRGLADQTWTSIEPGALPAGARVLVGLTAEGRRAYGLAH